MSKRTEVDRAGTLSARLAAHDLIKPAGTPDALDALVCGLQDAGEGTAVASLALRLGSAESAAAAIDSGHLVTAMTLRGAPHLHRAQDLAMIRAALAGATSRDLEATCGPLSPEVQALDDPVGAVAAAIDSTFDGADQLTKSELSGAAGERLDSDLAPYCPSCEIEHPIDGLFRLATLRCWLVLIPGEPSQTFRRHEQYAGLDVPAAAERDEARARMLDVALGLAQLADRDQIAGWLGLHRSSVPKPEPRVPAKATPAKSARLLPARDTWLRGTDRTWLLGTHADRRAEVFKSLGPPGVVLTDGEITGSWRQRKAGSKLQVEIAAWSQPTAAARKQLAADAKMIGQTRGLSTVVTYK